MSTLTRAAVILAVVACSDALAFTPAVFSARYRTPRRLATSLVIADVIACIAAAAVVAL